jgi:hypothetical protein
LREARALATVALKAAIRGIKLPGLQRTAQESLRTAPDGAWIFTQLDLAPNPWFGELPEAWIVMAARELGLTEQGAERENQRGYNPPTRQMHAVDTQLRAVSKMAVMGARAIWWKAAQLWGEQAKGKGLAVRNAIKAATISTTSFLRMKSGCINVNGQRSRKTGATDGHEQDGRRKNGWSGGASSSSGS